MYDITFRAVAMADATSIFYRGTVYDVIATNTLQNFSNYINIKGTYFYECLAYIYIGIK